MRVYLKNVRYKLKYMPLYTRVRKVNYKNLNIVFVKREKKDHKNLKWPEGKLCQTSPIFVLRMLHTPTYKTIGVQFSYFHMQIHLQIFNWIIEEILLYSYSFFKSLYFKLKKNSNY